MIGLVVVTYVLLGICSKEGCPNWNHGLAYWFEVKHVQAVVGWFLIQVKKRKIFWHFFSLLLSSFFFLLAFFFFSFLFFSFSFSFSFSFLFFSFLFSFFFSFPLFDHLSVCSRCCCSTLSLDQL